MGSFISIGSKLIFLVLVISITSIAVTTGLAYNFADTIIKGNIKESLKDESETRGQTITSIIESRLDKLQTFAQNNVLLETFDEVSASLDDVTFNTLLEEKIPLIKKSLNEVKKELKSANPVSKAQESLRLEQEKNKKEKKSFNRKQKEELKQQQFELKQKKKKEKLRGH